MVRCIKPDRPSDGRSGQRRSVTRVDENFDHRALKLPELPQVGGATVGGDAARRQTRGEGVALEAWPGPWQRIDARMEAPDTTAAHGVFELALRQPGVEPLPSRHQPVLARRQGKQRGENGRGSSEPERITHSE
jgi:hypothetical protein